MGLFLVIRIIIINSFDLHMKLSEKPPLLISLVDRIDAPPPEKLYARAKDVRKPTGTVNYFCL